MMATDALTVKVEFDKESAMNCIKNVIMEEYGMTLNELAELCKAKQEGRLVELPCILGAQVWYLTGNPSMTNRLCFDRVDYAKAVGFYWDERGLQIRLDSFHGNHGTYGFYGKTVFLDRESAEARLKGVQNDG